MKQFPEPWTGRLIGKMHCNRISITEVAQYLGWHKAYVGMILNSQRNPRDGREKLEAAVDALIEKRKENAV